MISIQGSPYRWCDGISRREFLQIGSLGTAGLALPQLFRARAQASTATAHGKGRAKACILLFMGGGPPQMDTFDLKPDAPAGVRGEFPPIATRVTGTQISELLPMLAQQAHRYAIIRTVSDEYTGGAHGQSVYLALTGHKNPRVQGDDVRPRSDDFPCMGSAVARLRGNGNALAPSSGCSTCTASLSPAKAAASLVRFAIPSASSKTRTGRTSVSRRLRLRAKYRWSGWAVAAACSNKSNVRVTVCLAEASWMPTRSEPST